MTNHSPDEAQIDRMFAALADPTRRAVVKRLVRGPASVTELAGDHPIALPSFLQHVRQLEAAGLIRTEKQGRVRRCTLEAPALLAVERWIIERRQEWEARLNRLGTYLDQLEIPDA
ncbi:metalloregulator ArsR/SmtB family transcription factor [Sphingomonas sp.]|uniref:ArsR/SmtB family transcription factor n=1 Tax=Sphingomonas sp. TaxID=28214 RepID=UPI001B23E761|nr:metalloregulator ArsR/SmtB family transcription factor [Sphingomonas sp.]MBO9713742.1 winged helix-turn-helix transcriptional regulator [Sphingomonas sp.]